MSFNFRVLFFVPKPILAKLGLLRDNRWCLRLDHDLMFDSRHVYVLGLFIYGWFESHIVGFSFNVLYLFFLFLSFLGFDPFLTKKYIMFLCCCMFNLFWVFVLILVCFIVELKILEQVQVRHVRLCLIFTLLDKGKQIFARQGLKNKITS